MGVFAVAISRMGAMQKAHKHFDKGTEILPHEGMIHRGFMLLEAACDKRSDSCAVLYFTGAKPNSLLVLVKNQLEWPRSSDESELYLPGRERF